MNRTITILCFSLLVGLAATSALARQNDAALGADGEIYIAQAGSYGALFPDASPEEANLPVLALNIHRPTGEVERLLVPDTKNATVESKPFLLFENESKALFLVWENRTSEFHSILKLNAYNGASWMGSIQVTGNHFSPKSAPQIATTRDTVKAQNAEGKPTFRHRTVLHLIWEEANLSGIPATFYSPLILEDGVFEDREPVAYELNLLDTSDAVATTFDISDLVKSPSIQSGRDGRTVAVALTSPTSRRLVTVEIDVLPQELARLADKARSVIIDLGARHFPNNMKALADQAKAAIDTQGSTDFQPEVVQAISEKVHAHILSTSAKPGLTNVADTARSVIIDLGARLSGRGLRGDSVAQKITEVARQSEADATPSPAHLLQFRVVSSRLAPRVGSEGLRVFVSEDAEDLLIAWQGEAGLQYRETRDDGSWSEMRETKLGGSLNAERAYEILEQRVRNNR